jgi:aldehyde dehydrogenase (NAD+)
MDVAANWAALGICYNSGQDCTAGSRLYVQDSIYDKFMEILVSKVKEQKFGDAFDETVSGGPLVSLALLPFTRVKVWTLIGCCRCPRLNTIV